jgi:hypothetical protein
MDPIYQWFAPIRVQSPREMHTSLSTAAWALQQPISFRLIIAGAVTQYRALLIIIGGRKFSC